MKLAVEGDGEIRVWNARVSDEGCWGQLQYKENEDESERSFFSDSLPSPCKRKNLMRKGSD